MDGTKAKKARMNFEALPAGAMKRNEILQPGGYVSIPKAWLADEKLTAGDKLVLIAYLDHLGPANRAAWPGPATIARETGMTRRGIQQSVERLVAGGWMTAVGMTASNTMGYIINRVRTPRGSAPNALLTECATSSEQNAPSGSALNAPELLKGTTEGNTEGMRAATPPLAAGKPRHSGSYATVSTPEDAAGNNGHDDHGNTAGTPPARRKGKAGPAPTLTDDQRQQVLASPAAMFNYFAFGTQGIGKTIQQCVDEGQKVSPTYWSTPGQSADEVRPDAAISAVAAYYWARAAYVRHEAGHPLMMPDMGKLCGIVKRLEAQHGRQWLLGHIDRTVGRWDEIQNALGSFGATLVLDEGTLGMNAVIHQSLRLAAGEDIMRPTFRYAS